MEHFLENWKPKWNSFKESMYLLAKNKLSLLAFAIIILLLAGAISAPFIVPYPEDVYSTHIESKLQPPSEEHIMGTDDLGRDVFSRVVYATRVSISTALVAVGVALLIGIPLGAIAGVFGGWIDNVIMRITDIFLSFPPLLLAIALVALLGSGLTNAIIAIVVSWWPWYTRLVRGQAVSIKERKFVQAAETIGTSKAKIIFKHIIPNCISPVIVQASMDIGGVIMTVASLSFLSLGAQQPTPEGRAFFPDKWWCCIFPGIAIFLTVLSFNLLGDAIREILDPKTRKR